jgi:hypothetical protein
MRQDSHPETIPEIGNPGGQPNTTTACESWEALGFLSICDLNKASKTFARTGKRTFNGRRDCNLSGFADLRGNISSRRGVVTSCKYRSRALYPSGGQRCPGLRRQAAFFPGERIFRKMRPARPDSDEAPGGRHLII